MKIDLNRGVSMRFLPGTDIRICMYRDEPGIYRDAFGKEVPIESARKAGFPVDRLAKIRRRDEELAMVKARMEKELDLRTSGEVYRELNGYRIIKFDNGYAHIENPDGERITPQPISLALAQDYLKDLAGATPPVKAEGVKAEPGIGNAPEAAPSPPTTSTQAQDTKPSAPKKGAGAMLK